MKHLDQLELQKKTRINEKCSEMFHAANVQKLQMSTECRNSIINTSACIRSNLESTVGKEIESVRNQLFARNSTFTNVSIKLNSDNDEFFNEDSNTPAQTMETRKRKSEALSSPPHSQSKSTSIPIMSNLFKNAAPTDCKDTLALSIKKRRNRFDEISSTLQSELVNKLVDRPKEKKCQEYAQKTRHEGFS